MAEKDLKKRYPWVGHWTSDETVDIMFEQSKAFIASSEKDALKKHFLGEIYQSVINKFKPENVFDLGCASAISLHIIKTMAPNVTCIGGDISIKLLEKAREINSEFLYTQCDGLNLAFRDRAFDMVVSEDVQCIVLGYKELLQE